MILTVGLGILVVGVVDDFDSRFVDFGCGGGG